MARTDSNENFEKITPECTKTVYFDVKIWKKCWGEAAPSQDHPHWGGGHPLTIPHLPQRLRRLDLPLFRSFRRQLCRGVGNFPTNFGVSGSRRSRLIGQHLSDTSHDLATLTFHLGDHRACRWYESSCSICVPSFKLVGLSVRKIWHTSGLSISLSFCLSFCLCGV